MLWIYWPFALPYFLKENKFTRNFPNLLALLNLCVALRNSADKATVCGPCPTLQKVFRTPKIEQATRNFFHLTSQFVTLNSIFISRTFIVLGCIFKN